MPPITPPGGTSGGGLRGGGVSTRLVGVVVSTFFLSGSVVGAVHGHVGASATATGGVSVALRERLRTRSSSLRAVMARSLFA
jgi:hypothetical protein